MLKYKDLQKGDIVSETTYSTVQEITKSGTAVLLDINGNKAEVGDSYLETMMNTADQYTNTEKMNQSELIKILLANPNKACSVYFKKQNTAKTKKKFNEDVTTWLEAAEKAFLDEGRKGLKKFATDQVQDYIPGEMRLMRGYHEGEQDDRGRIKFIDMEDENKVKVVDPRTLQYIIVNDVKNEKR